MAPGTKPTDASSCHGTSRLGRDFHLCERLDGNAQQRVTQKTEQKAKTSRTVLVTRLAATTEYKTTTFILFPTLPRLMVTVGEGASTVPDAATWRPTRQPCAQHVEKATWLAGIIVVFSSS